jgi:hypothetical protein
VPVRLVPARRNNDKRTCFTPAKKPTQSVADGIPRRSVGMRFQDLYTLSCHPPSQTEPPPLSIQRAAIDPEGFRGIIHAVRGDENSANVLAFQLF